MNFAALLPALALLVPATKPDLKSSLNASLISLLAGKNTNDNFAFTLPLSTCTNVWTWPLKPSCVGDTGGGFGTLIAPNMVLGNQHTLAGRLLFTSPSGAQYVANVTNFIASPITDFAVGILETNMPPDIEPAWIFPPQVTNYLAGGVFDGVLGFWYRNTTHTAPIGVFHSYDITSLGLYPVLTNDFGIYEEGQGGDSTSPAFVILFGKLIIMFDTTGAQPDGWPVFSPYIWPLVPKEGLRIVDLSGYQGGVRPPGKLRVNHR